MASAFNDSIRLLDVKCVEPKKRLVKGRFGWAVHKYPIKNGLTFRETVWKDWLEQMAANICKNNSLLDQLKEFK